MTFSLLNSMLQRLSDSPRWPLLVYAATWTTLLTVTVAVASFSPELAFVSVITSTPSSNSNSFFSRGCQNEESVRVPLDLPVEVVCLPAPMFRRSKMDILVPPLFAAVIVAFSAFVVRALALWEVDVEAG